MKHALFLGGSKGLGYEMMQLARKENYAVMVASRTTPIVGSPYFNTMKVDLEADITPSCINRGYDLIVWTAGSYQTGPILDLESKQIRAICRNHLEGPASFLLPILRLNRGDERPVHLVVVASSSSYRVRVGEGLYGTLKAAKAQFARTLGAELPNQIPGSKVLLANPGGMNTPFWDGHDQPKRASFMDPAAVAKVIWDEMKAQTLPFDEIHIDRQPDGTPKLERGIRPPVMP